MSIYGQSIDAILHSFLLDESMNKEKGRDAQFTPPVNIYFIIGIEGIHGCTCSQNRDQMMFKKYFVIINFYLIINKYYYTYNLLQKMEYFQ